MEEAKNYAKDRDFANEIMLRLYSCWYQVYTNRISNERRWYDVYNSWSVNLEQDSELKNYKGRANIKLPQLRKEVETMSRRIVKGLFPDDYLKAEPSKFVNEDLAVANTYIVRHYYDNVMNLKQSVMPWVKQGVLYGTSPMRQYWKKDVNKQLFKKRVFTKDKNGLLVSENKTVYEEVVQYDAPVVEACDLFQTWIYPESAAKPKDIEIVFNRSKVTLDWLRTQEKNKLAILPSDIENMGKDVDVEFDKTQLRLAAQGLTGIKKAPPGTKYYDLLECWVKLDIKGVMTPCVVWIIDATIPIRIQQNPYWHQEPPFAWMRFIIPPPGEFYGRGLPEASLAVQYQLDDVLNQSMDSTTLSLNNITVINPAFAPNAASFEVEPGAIWWADPNAVKQFVTPDLSDIGIKNANMLRSIITEMSDNTPQLPDPIAGKARSTGQAQLAINEWQTDLFNFLEQISIEGLTVLAKQTHSLLQQNLPDDTIIRVAGKYATQWVNRVVTPEDLVGGFDFKWVGNIAIDNNSVKTQQMLNFLKILPMIPQDSGIKFNWENFVILLLREGFQIKSPETLISTAHLNASVPPNIENKIINQGGEVEVCEQDDDDLHIKVHAIDGGKSKDVYIQSLYVKHIKDHEDAKAKKIQIMQMMQQQMQQQQLMLAQQGPPKGKSGGANNPQGNQTQLSQSSNPADYARGMGGAT